MARHHDNMRLRNPDGSGRGQERHIEAMVAKVFPDTPVHDGAAHQHIWIDQVKALDGLAPIDGRVFVAVRVGDSEGINGEIPFKVDTPVELQGMFIPADQADPGQDNPGLPVMHFTHHPIGFVEYEGKRYA